MSGRLTPFTPPNYEIGTPVLWYATADRSDIPLVGFITTPYRRNATIFLFNHGSRGVKVVSAYHMDDPIQGDEGYSGGGWEYTPAHRRMLRVEELLASKDPELAASLKDPLPAQHIEDLVGEAYQLGAKIGPTMGKPEISLAVKVGRLNRAKKQSNVNEPAVSGS